MHTPKYRILSAADHAKWSGTDEFAVDVLVGLSEQPKRLNSRWLYDDLGSDLFARIMNADAYYPTRTEREVFDTRGDELLAPISGPINLVDLGAGNGLKTERLITRLRARDVRLRYVPIDISEGAMQGVTERLAERFGDPAESGVEIAGLVSDYVDGLRFISGISERTSVALFLGSNIGNFNRSQARGFLRRLWDALSPGDYLLIGFDMKKDIEVLLRAYNDDEGLTREFNLNLLDRINRELGADFDREKFRHYGTYNVVSGAMESYLVSLERQTVYIDQLKSAFEFHPWEPIHTEYSYKYLASDIEELASFTGYEIVTRAYDPKGWFCDSLWRVVKDER